jgi:hypothetical protein
MRGAIPPLPQYAFMAWCSIGKSTGTTLPLPSTFEYYTTGRNCAININFISFNITFYNYEMEALQATHGSKFLNVLLISKTSKRTSIIFSIGQSSRNDI